MQSIAIWNSGSENDVELELHINFWNPKKGTKRLDFGLKLRNPESIEKVHLFFPFQDVKKEQFKDLSEVISSNHHLANAVFNRSININNIADTNYYDLSENQVNIVNLYGIDTQTFECESKFDGTVVDIPLPLDKRKNLYIRFALTGSFLNNYFMSVMSYEPLVSTTMFKTELFEFRINSNRHLPPSLLEHIRQNKLFRLSRVHLFLMISAEEDILHANTDSLQGRLLEHAVWNSYFGTKNTSLKKRPVIAYHFKKDSKNSKTGLDQYSQLVKTKGRRSPLLTWLFYLLIVLAIGLTTEAVSQFMFKKVPEFKCPQDKICMPKISASEEGAKLDVSSVPQDLRTRSRQLSSSDKPMLDGSPK